MTEPVKCNCRHPECTTCNPPEPDPTAAELARVVAWLRARAKVYRAWAKVVEPEERDFNHIRADVVGIIADDLERGEQP